MLNIPVTLECNLFDPESTFFLDLKENGVLMSTEQGCFPNPTFNTHGNYTIEGNSLLLKYTHLDDPDNQGKTIERNVEKNVTFTVVKEKRLHKYWDDGRPLYISEKIVTFSETPLAYDMSTCYFKRITDKRRDTDYPRVWYCDILSLGSDLPVEHDLSNIEVVESI